MISYTDIHTAIRKKIQSVYDTNRYNYYSMSVTESYLRPCFFSVLKPLTNTIINRNIRKNKAICYITYMQKIADEAETEKMVDVFKGLFCLNLPVKDRVISISSLEIDYLGKNNALQAVIELEWVEKIQQKEIEEETIENIEINRGLEEE